MDVYVIYGLKVLCYKLRVVYFAAITSKYIIYSMHYSLKWGNVEWSTKVVQLQSPAPHAFFMVMWVSEGIQTGQKHSQ